MLQIPNPPLDLHLSGSNGFVSSTKYINFDFDIVNFPFLDGDVPCDPFMGFTLHNLLGLQQCPFM